MRCPVCNKELELLSRTDDGSEIRKIYKCSECNNELTYVLETVVTRTGRRTVVESRWDLQEEELAEMEINYEEHYPATLRGTA